MTLRYRTLVLVGTLLVLSLALGASLTAGEFDKVPGSFYMGGTEGLSGIDSARGYVDSVYYSKWWEAGIKPSTAGSPDKVIYGEDDRVDVYTVSDPNLLRLAQACAVVVSLSEISDNGDGTYTLDVEQWLSQSGLPLCTDEPFRGQLRIGNCSGFLVGEDIIVTAGHCLSEFSCGSWAFLFGFQQIDSLTGPNVIVPEDNIYFCTEVLGQANSGDLDYCVSRVDRPVVGRQPLPIRRDGVVPDGDSLVVVGHPAVLPMKIAGGAIVQDNNGSTEWFQANLDTYGGNSGSMVVNTGTWEIEGILVRGAPDYVNGGGCTESNRVPDSGNNGSGLEFEEVSKTTSFVQYVPELVNSTGVLFVQDYLYSCDDTVEVEIRDIDLAGNGTHVVTVTSSLGDSEDVTLVESGPSTGIFSGSVALLDGAVMVNDGTLQAGNADSVVATYEDADDGSGSPATLVEVGSVDCISPSISNVMLDTASGVSATITFDTDEPCTGRVLVGTSCGNYTAFGAGGQTTSHSIAVGGLSPLTDYSYAVEATDIAGNVLIDDRTGSCHQFTTLDQADYFTQLFTAGNDVEGRKITFAPDGSVDFYDACGDTISAFPTDPGNATVITLSDDGTQQVTLTDGAQVYLYGEAYSSVSISANGYVTLGFVDGDYSETLDEHFDEGPRVAAMWDDFDPPDGGTISYEQFDDRFVVTWDGVYEINTSNTNQFQLELFFDGTIVMSHVDITISDGLVGLSQGNGEPPDFIMSDFSAYPTCVYLEPSCCVGLTGNLDGDPGDNVSLADLTVMIDHLFVSFAEIDCMLEANTDGIGEDITIGDLTALIDHLYVSFQDLAPCQEE